MAKTKDTVLPVIDERPETPNPVDAAPKKKRAPKGESVAELKRKINALETELHGLRMNCESAYAKANEMERILKDQHANFTKTMNFVSNQINSAAAATNLILKGDL